MANLENWEASYIDVNGVYHGGVSTTSGNLETSSGNISTVSGYVASGTYIRSDEQQLDVKTYSTDGAVDEGASMITVSGLLATCDRTIASPKIDKLLTVVCLDSTNSCTITLTAGTWDGTSTIATFTVGDSLQVVGISSTRFAIINNNGVILS